MPHWEIIQTTQFWLALGSIILIDIVLAGDNAIVIALAARRLPIQLQRRAIALGTIGAIVMRALLTLIAVKLLEIPGLMIVGGLLLLWIAYKLLIDEDEQHHAAEATTLKQALQTILIADTVMSLDNVLAIAGASQGNFLLVILGLLISIPLVVWGSTIILRLLSRFPALVYLGAAVLVITAIQMIFKDPTIRQFWTFPFWFILLTHAIALLLTLGLGQRSRKNKSSKRK